MTFSHIEESRPSTSWHSSDSSKHNKENYKDEANLDKQLEHLDIFEQKQRTDESMWHRRNLALFHESMKTFRSQGKMLSDASD